MFHKLYLSQNLYKLSFKFKNLLKLSSKKFRNLQGGRGHWAVNYTSPQSFRIMFSLKTYIEFWLVVALNLVFQRYQPLIIIYRKGNFICHHWDCASVNRPLSYPFRALHFCIFFICILEIENLYYKFNICNFAYNEAVQNKINFMQKKCFKR